MSTEHPAPLPESPAEPENVSLGQATAFWFKLGWISFGGPAGQIAIMHQELVERRRWISERRFLHALNYCMLLPGPEAQQLATYLGWLMHRVPGGLIAGLLFVLPSMFILCALAWGYLLFGQQGWVAALFYGIKPAVVAIVIHAAWRVGQRTLKTPLAWSLALAAFLAVFVFAVPFPYVVLAAALIGWLVKPAAENAGHHIAGNSTAPIQTALIDDHSPTPAHLRYTHARLIKTCGITAALWLMPMLALLGLGDSGHGLLQLAWFFTKAALLTFGGAYAVLPYVYQGAVERHAWLSPTQMIDGLALGETTPGPLIMVVCFVGFVAGYQQAWFGPEQAWLAGATAALVVTWFTFLPSFFFIFAGGPWVESSRRQPRLHGPLSAITAAIVGVILNLGCFFALHTFWPQGLNAAPEWPSIALASLALFALLRLRRSVLEVIVLCASLGGGYVALWH